MITRILLLAAILFGLVYWESSLASTRSLDRSSSSRLRPLMDEATREGMVVAGVRVETASGENFLYGRSRGVWRLIEPEVNTYVSPGAVEQLMRSFTEAQGVVLTEEKHRAKSYGFGGDVALRITLHGTKLRSAKDQDVLYTLDVGFPIQGTEGSYVRPLGTQQVWSIDQNPRAYLARPPGSSFPPMLDPYVIPTLAAAEKGSVVAIEIRSKASENFTLRMTKSNLDDPGSDEPATTWELTREDGSVVPCDEIPARGYAIYMFLAPYSKIIGAESVDPEILSDPDIRMTLTPSRGEPFELLFGRPTASGSRAVANFDTKTMFEISGDVAELMLPLPEVVAEEAQGNPWHDFIQVNPLEGRDLVLNPISTR